ncbi:hypothetical protein RFI_17928 [Reticulomyxa filosa]|uniref:Uncharacterized protein n=1 Tax=Reticulomyxa filosa TaxID=46433 RepID=X6MZ28_RETFI|nr:hypothetical protein RFI_17928 [Reticulomyxa filosa]|eukprot:ETO19300.1 hypothetical protein RFI_17928 [Reticulomyxa filosa]
MLQSSGFYDTSLIKEDKSTGITSMQYTTMLQMFPDWNSIQTDYQIANRYTWSTIMSGMGGFFTILNVVLTLLLLFLASGYDCKDECYATCCRCFDKDNTFVQWLCHSFQCCVKYPGVAGYAGITKRTLRKQTENWAKERELTGKSTNRALIDTYVQQTSRKIQKLETLLGF